MSEQASQETLRSRIASWLRGLLGRAPLGRRVEHAEGPIFRARWSIDPGFPPRGRSVEVDVAIHPSQGLALVVMMPGWEGDIDGYEDKYLKLAQLIRSQGIGAVVRLGNPEFDGVDFEEACRGHLRDAVDQALARSAKICGATEPKLYFFGTSAGASAMAALADRWPQLEKMLLVAPSADAGYEAACAGLLAFSGEVSVVAGRQDEVVGSLPEELSGIAPPGARRRFVGIDHCDHQFRGAINGRIYSQAPLWAFADDDPFPDPDRGIHLYD